MILKITRWIFLVLVLTLPLVRPFELNILGLRATLTDFVFVILLAAIILSAAFHQLLLHVSKFHVFIGLFAISLLPSLATSDNLKRSMIKLLAELYLFLLSSAAYWLIRNSPDFINRVAMAWTGGTILTILGSICGFALFYLGYKTQSDNFFLSHFGSLPSGNYPRIHSTFANANMMTNYLNVSLVMIFVLFARRFLKGLVSGFLIAGLSFAALFTFSAGLGGLFLSAGFWIRSRFRENGRITSGRIAIACAIFLALAAFGSTLFVPNSANTDQDVTLPVANRVIEPSVRVLVWQNALQTIGNFPIAGKGIGLDPVMVRYQTPSGDNQILLDAHNSWLNIAGQTGLVGLAGLAALTAYLLTICVWTPKPDSELSNARFLMSCGFVGVFIYQSFSGSFEDARHIWILFGILAGLASAETDAAVA